MAVERGLEACVCCSRVRGPSRTRAGCSLLGYAVAAPRPTVGRVEQSSAACSRRAPRAVGEALGACPAHPARSRGRTADRGLCVRHGEKWPTHTQSLRLAPQGCVTLRPRAWLHEEGPAPLSPPGWLPCARPGSRRPLPGGWGAAVGAAHMLNISTTKLQTCDAGVAADVSRTFWTP